MIHLFKFSIFFLEIPPKQPKTASALTYKAVNGKIIAPVRRGRKPGSLNKNKLGKTVKTLQTLSPIKKTQEVRYILEFLFSEFEMRTWRPTISYLV